MSRPVPFEDLEQGQADLLALPLQSLSPLLIYEYRESQPGQYEWHSLNVDDVHKEPKLSESAKVRLVLLEGVPAKSSEDDSSPWFQLPSWFYEGHEKETVPSLSSKLEGCGNSFFAKWLCYQTQEDIHWDIENRIDDAGKRQALAKRKTNTEGLRTSTEKEHGSKQKSPTKEETTAGQDLPPQGYSLDTVTDPSNLRLDHDRYNRWPQVYRPYDPILNTKSEVLGHAALECISLFWKQNDKGVGTGFVIFDPTRKHIVVKKKYTFWGTEKDPDSVETSDCFIKDKATRDRFISDLTNYDKPAAILETPRSTMLDIISQMIVDDAVTVLSRLNQALDEVDLSMADDETLRKSLRDWRNYFGRWRKAMLHERASLAYVRRALGQHSTSSSSQSGAANSISTPGQRNIEDRLYLVDELEATQKRIDGTFQALMSTMSIIESQKAIAQAETVSKLTYLAFFFIPPTFVTGIFGMNVVEFTGQLKAWIWVVCSLTVSIAAYIMLFWAEINIGIRKSPDLVVVNRYKVTKWVRTLYYYLKKASAWIVFSTVYLGVLAGLGVGLWKLYTSHLSKGAKAGISVGIFFIPLALAFQSSFTSR